MRQFTLPERNGLVYKPHPRFLAQNFSKKVRLIHESLRYALLMKILIFVSTCTMSEEKTILQVLRMQSLNVYYCPCRVLAQRQKPQEALYTVVSPAYTYEECVNIGVVCL